MGINKYGSDTSFTAWYQSLDTRILRTQWGTGLDHAFIVHFELMCVIVHDYVLIIVCGTIGLRNITLGVRKTK